MVEPPMTATSRLPAVAAVKVCVTVVMPGLRAIWLSERLIHFATAQPALLHVEVLEVPARSKTELPHLLRRS